MGSSSRKHGPDDWEQVQANDWQEVPPVAFPGTTEEVKKNPIREAPFDPALRDPGAVAAFGDNLTNTLTLGQGKRIDAALTALTPKEGTKYGERYRKLMREHEDQLRAAHQYHPYLSFAGGAIGGAPYYAALPEGLVGQVGGSAALGGAQALGDSPNFAGSKGTNAQAWNDAGEGAAWGAAGGVAGRYLERAAPERAGKMADHYALRGSGGNTPTRMEQLRGAFPVNAPPGELADVLYGQKVLKPWMSGEKAADSYASAFERMGKKLGAMRDAAAASGHNVRISEVERLLEDEAGHLFPYNAQARAMRDKVVETLKMHAYGAKVGRPFGEVAELVRQGNPQVLGDLANMKTPFESVTLPQLQESLVGTGIQKGATDAYAAVRGKNASPSEQQENFMAVHRGLRRAEDENLEASGVVPMGSKDGRDLRRTMAAVKVGERVAGKAASQEHGKDPLGLFGWATLGSAHAGGHGATGTGAALGIALARRFYGNELNTTAGWLANKAQNAMQTDGGRFLLRAGPEMAAPQLGPKVADLLQQPGVQPLPPAVQQTMEQIEAARKKGAMELEALKARAAMQQDNKDEDVTDEELLNAP